MTVLECKLCCDALRILITCDLASIIPHENGYAFLKFKNGQFFYYCPFCGRDYRKII